MILVGVPLDHAADDQVVETSGEEVARDPEVLGQLIEAGQAQVQVTQHQRRPRIADRVERSCHRAVHRAEVSSCHRPQA
jgi:hypothetical protein